jgi:hypothetical protein
MTTIPMPRTTHRPALAKLISDRCAEITDVRAGSRWQTHRLTICERGSRRPLFTAVIADREESTAAVEHEGRLLVELRRGDYGPAALVAPRHIGVAEHCGRPVLLLSPPVGPPLGSAGRRPTRRDVAAVVEWLVALWDGGRQNRCPPDLGAAAVDALLTRHSSEAERAGILDRLCVARARVSRVRVPQTMSHGALSPDRVTVTQDRVTGVDDWGRGTIAGDPLRDLAGFAVACADLRMDFLLSSRRSVATALRAGIRRGLTALGVDTQLGGELLLLAVAEHAAATDERRRQAGLEALDAFLALTGESP